MGLLDIGVNGAIGAVGGLLQNGANKRAEKRQFNNQKKLMEIQQKNQQELNQQGKDLQLQQWKDTNYPAQMEMLKQAGLNPGLLYGMSGGGGATTGSQGGGSAAGGNAPQSQPVDIGSQIMNAQTLASIELTKAQTEKTKAETEKTSGTDTEESQTRIAKLIAETKNEALKGQLMQVQKDILDIEKAWKPSIIETELQQTVGMVKKLSNENNILAGTTESIIMEAQGKAIGQLLVNALNESHTKLNNENIIAIKNGVAQKWEQVAQGWQNLSIQEKRTKIDTFEAEIKAEFPSVLQTSGKIVKDMLRNWEGIMEKLFGSTPPKDKVK